MANRISADTVFHFTNSHEKLIGILQSTFKPSYCWEDIATLKQGNKKEIPDFAMPMVSFCDIPLSQITFHAETYGCYGIGLTKEWAIEKGMNPVFYFIPDSKASLAFRAVPGNTKKIKISSAPDQVAVADVLQNISQVAYYAKLYKGKPFRDGAYKEVKVFYDEREWRYIPDYSELKEKHLDPHVPWAQHLKDEGFLKRSNSILGENFKLHFTPNDIRFIIVNNEDEILPTARKIYALKSGFSIAERVMLITRLVSMDRINSDF